MQPRSPHACPIALTIAGSDSGGGAGIQADLKAFSALGVYGASVIAALTAQNTREVRAIQDVPPEFIRSQIQTVFDDLAVGAVKIGMLSQPAVIAVVAEELQRYGARNIVLDPVMVAKSGDKLLAEAAVESLRTRLLPLATILTPNLPEAAVLLECAEPADRDEMILAARALLEFGPQAVLLKGGHLQGQDSADLLCTRDQLLWLPARRIDTRNTHGTGCTLSSAIAAELAKGMPVQSAIENAKAYISAAIAAADRLEIGSGHGPVHHFHHWW
ncbi:bifunctional hydroxymethylpyrimidine kinase/phosphomethylpyrimidine kinase [Marinobacterium rhizophilum]|uniref:hydroxymethylpyrimidine kinase n=1 Tax=Marinobacterium rhizophilum TaxID=420402 RepID=A0ABY5HGD4_9GAMM|nr:bifunctional hydroxymethylpyrimidine kinase/phosphomethylpyrimidine kinase [Marinobacterium rhizophilum]UTW11303.1 bifunctional hydroxymethylpyrimidine kinase/phosphomethylpyrimidine kinase [Marinobacterium rhizophilum]